MTKPTAPTALIQDATVTARRRGLLIVLPTSVPQSARVVHLIPVTRSTDWANPLVAVCGARLPVASIAVLDQTTDTSAAMGPCERCWFPLITTERAPIEPAPPDRGDVGEWHDYYRHLGWPVIRVNDAVLLVPDSLRLVAMATDLVVDVRRVLQDRDRDTPEFSLPEVDDEVLLVVRPALDGTRTLDLLAAVPGLHRITIPVSLPTGDDPESAWITPPWAQPLPCNELDVASALVHARRNQRPPSTSPGAEPDHHEEGIP